MESRKEGRCTFDASSPHLGALLGCPSRIVVVAGALATLLAGCTQAVESSGQQSEGAVSGATEAFQASVYPSNVEDPVSPFHIAYIERSMEWARIVAASGPFAGCVAQRMAEQYTPCDDDPYSSSSSAVQASEAWDALIYRQNHLEIRYKDVDGSASAYIGNPTDYDGEWFRIENKYDEDFGDWTGGDNQYDTPSEPWKWRADDFIHEFMHTAGYTHQTGCPGVPYIYGGCAQDVVETSYALCGDPRACGPGSKMLGFSWDESTQQASGSCECVRDSQHVVDFTLTSGNAITALDGGGGALSGSWGPAVGAWQRFYAYFYGRSGWLPGWNLAWVRPREDFFVSPGWANAAMATPITQWIQLPSTYTAGQSEVMTALWSGAYVNPYSGSTIQTQASHPGLLIRMREPRRDHLVYLKTAHNRFVNIPAGQNWLYNQPTDLSLSVPDTDRVRSAFWVVDHNGGELEFGDPVSFEGVIDQVERFWSTSGNNGHVTTTNSYYTHQTFVLVSPYGATGPIGHGDTIAIRSSIGTYVTAMPPSYYASQLRNYGTYVGSWQRFEIQFVEQFDIDRTTW